MAMNKKEQAEMAALRRELAIASSFVRTERVLPDVARPLPGSGRMNYGFLYQGTNYGVMPAWSDSIAHGFKTKDELEAAGNYRSGSQGSRSLYSTRLLALKAHRWDVEQECARKLADVDAMIAAERAEPTP